jgi:hypothetical protein
MKIQEYQRLDALQRRLDTLPGQNYGAPGFARGDLSRRLFAR